MAGSSNDVQRGTTDALNDYAQVDSAGQPVVGDGGKKILNVNATVSSAPATSGILTYGSDDGGTTPRVIHTNAAGDVQVDLASAIPAGTNNIGDVDIASAIPAGSNIIGNVRIDQTTPGTTNAVSPTYYSETIAAAATAANANLTTAASNALGAPYKYVALQMNATGLDAADGVIKLQDSLDGTNFTDISGASITVASGASINMIRNTAFTGKHVRAVWTKGANAAGTFELLLMFKN